MSDIPVEGCSPYHRSRSCGGRQSKAGSEPDAEASISTSNLIRRCAQPNHPNTPSQGCPTWKLVYTIFAAMRTLGKI